MHLKVEFLMQFRFSLCLSLSSPPCRWYGEEACNMATICTVWQSVPVTCRTSATTGLYKGIGHLDSHSVILFLLLHTLKKLSKGALWGINWRQLPLPLDNLLHLSSGKIVTFENLFFYQTFLVEKITVICLEDDVVGLWVAHDEDQIDDEESKKIFGNHPIDHDHKGADNLECPGEKSLVAMRMQ